jgi:hypothetical protein
MVTPKAEAEAEAAGADGAAVAGGVQ